MKQIVVSFSGGRTSAYLCSLIKKLHPEAVFVFMDTGAEHPATYDFVCKCNDYFGLNLVCLRAKVSQEQGIGVGYEIIDISTPILYCCITAFGIFSYKYFYYSGMK